MRELKGWRDRGHRWTVGGLRKPLSRYLSTAYGSRARHTSLCQAIWCEATRGECLHEGRNLRNNLNQLECDLTDEVLAFNGERHTDYIINVIVHPRFELLYKFILCQLGMLCAKSLILRKDLINCDLRDLILYSRCSLLIGDVLGNTPECRVYLIADFSISLLFFSRGSCLYARFSTRIELINCDAYRKQCVITFVSRLALLSATDFAFPAWEVAIGPNVTAFLRLHGVI